MECHLTFNRCAPFQSFTFLDVSSRQTIQVHGIKFQCLLYFFSGYLRDVSGDYFLTYHFVGTLTMCASLVLFVSHYKVKDVSEAVIEIDVEEEKERS